MTSKDEIRAALKIMKYSEAAGGDQIPTEAPKAGGETTLLCAGDEVYHRPDLDNR